MSWRHERNNSPWPIVAALLILAGLVFAHKAHACEPFTTTGKTVPAKGSEPVGVAGLGCRFDTAYGMYDLSAVYVAEQKLYNGALRDPGYPLLTINAVYQPFEHKLFGGTPELYWGNGFKEADRCAYNGESHCNRRQPLPYSFHFGAGLEWSRIRLQLLHDSNNAMDWGPEAKNRGITWLTIVKRFRK